MDAKHGCSLTLLAFLSTSAFAYPTASPGAEDIPKMMAVSALVCKGEVVEAPMFSISPARAPDLTATVRPDRCFKGSLNTSSISVLFDGSISPDSPSFVLHRGDYLLFFLTPQNGAYAVVNPWFGALPVSRNLVRAPASGDEMYALEQDLEAGLQDPDRELVLDSIQMLGDMKHLRSTSDLVALLDSSDLLVKTYTWQAFLRLKDYSVLPAVSGFFASQPGLPHQLSLPRDRLFYIQQELIVQIGVIRDPAALAFLESFAVNGKSLLLRSNALQALRAINSPHSASTFLTALDDANPEITYSAMQGLLSLAGPGPKEWVPTWKQFDEAPTLYAAKCREWWRIEGEQKMLSKIPARPY